MDEKADTPSGAGSATASAAESTVLAIERPDRALLEYYALSSLLLGPFFFLLLVPRFFRYRTLRYRFDQEGVSMRWGVLFRREINLTYARIQDIHLVSNLLERWLGLARIKVQTASGSAGAEMTIEGLQEFQAVRDFLYSRMRGSRRSASGRGAADGPAATVRPAAGEPGAGPAVVAAPGGVAAPSSDELAATLREVAAELRALRESLQSRPRAGGEG